MKLLIGGSPCTHWSIAQTKNRDTEPSGIGWELFENYLIALEKYKPDFSLYENNKSMSAAIREQITKELGVEPIEINSALVSAQSRKRLYWTNIPGVGQPEDKGILLRDILETGVVWREKAYTRKANYTNAGAVNGVDGGHFPAPMAAEPVRIGTIESFAEGEGAESRQYRVYSPDGKGVTLAGTDGGGGVATGLYAAPLRVGDMPNAAGEISGSQSGRIYSTDGKSVSLQARPNGGGADGAATGLYAVPSGIAWRGRGDSSSYEMRDDQKANAVTADGHQSRLVVEDAAIFQQPRGFNKGGIKYEKTPTLTANGDWAHNNLLIESADGKTHPVYEVRDGQITIKGKQYPIKLADGFYIIRKLTVTECKRLQTVPEDYVFPVSDTQAYKMLGNGWTVDVIAHILSHAPGITTEPVEVLSMYDGMSCGQIALRKIGATVTKYYATEIDKYAIQTTQHNFPDTIQLGDAFQVREGKVNRRNCMDSTDKILARDFSEEFIQLMKNRILTSHYKYGWICDTYPELADAVACLDQRLALYRESGNTEHLVDVANFAMIEFMRPRHPQAHFKGTDSDQSPGLVGTSYKQLMEGIEHEA